MILLIIAEVIGPDDHGSPKTWASVAKIIIGLVLIAGAIRTWVAQPAQGEGIPRRWLDRIDDITASVAAGLGAAVGAFNGKNFLLTAAAAVTIAQTGIRVIEQFVPLAVYVAIAGLCVLAPVAAYLVFGDRAAAWLNRLREWLVAHGPAIMGILFLLIGLSLIGGGIRELSG